MQNEITHEVCDRLNNNKRCWIIGYKKMALTMTVGLAKGDAEGFPAELSFSTQFLEFLCNQSDSDREILEKGFHVEEFGEKSIVKCCLLRDALRKLIEIAEIDNKLFIYSLDIKNDIHSGGGARGLSGKINGHAVCLTGGIGQCWLEWMAEKDDNPYEYYCYRREDISDKTEIQLDKLGVINILKKKAKNLLELPTLKALLQKLESCGDDNLFEIIIG